MGNIIVILFFFNDTATTEIYTLSLHDALPICARLVALAEPAVLARRAHRLARDVRGAPGALGGDDHPAAHDGVLPELRHVSDPRAAAVARAARRARPPAACRRRAPRPPPGRSAA